MKPSHLTKVFKTSVILTGLFAASFAIAEDVVVKDASALEVTAKIPVGGDFMGVGFGSLWMANGKLNRIDVATNKVVAQIPVGPGSYRGISVGEGFVWVPATGDQTLYKVDPNQNKVVGKLKLKFFGSESSVGVGSGSVWIVTNEENQKEALTRVDVATMQVVAKIEMPSDCGGVVFGENSVWVALRSASKLLRIDPTTNKIVKEIATGQNPNFISYGEGAVWTLNQGDGTVTRVNPDNTAVNIDAKLPGGGGDISAGEGGVYMTMPEVPVSKIDPATNKLVLRFEGSGFGDALRVGYGSVWVSGGNIFRIALPK